MGNTSVPTVGSDVYIESALFISHGVDDRMGGLARVIEVTQGLSAGQAVCFIAVAEIPRTHFNWEHLAPLQDKLKKEFGENRAYLDPDNSPESNEFW